MQIIINNLLKGSYYPSERNNRIISSTNKKVDRKKVTSKDRGLTVNDKKPVAEYIVEIHTARTTKELSIRNSTVSLANSATIKPIDIGEEVWLICETPERRENGIKPLYRFYFPKYKFSFPLYRDEFEWCSPIRQKVTI